MMKRFAIGLSLAALTGVGAPHAQNAPKVDVPSISVDGVATVDVKPDVATLTLGAQDEEHAAADAIANVAKASTAIVADLRSLGVEPDAIKTQEVLLTPVYAETVDPKTHATTSALSGYRAAMRLVARIRDVAQAGMIVRHVAERGANSFDGLSFIVSDADAQIDMLRGAAVANAKKRAALYAQGASMKLGRVLFIEPEADSGPSSARPLRRAAAAAGSGAIPIPVEPGLITLSAHVRASWALEPE